MSGNVSSHTDVDTHSQPTYSTLSQGPCAVCRRVMAVTSAGLIHAHGPVGNRCPGSRLSPSTTTASTAASPHQPPQAVAPHSEAHGGPELAFGPPRASVKTLKRIPRASRDLAVTKMAAVLEGVVSSNDTALWDRLYRFAARCLQAPRRGGHRRSLASHINHIIGEEVDPDPPQPGPGCCPSPPTRDPLESLAVRVASKVEEGDFKGAVRLACSEDSIAGMNERTLTALREKHPAPPPGCSISSVPAEVTSMGPLVVSAGEVAKAIHSFPCGSAGGPDDLRPKHLKNMISPSAVVCGTLLLEAITSFVNLVVEGKTPPPVCPFFLVLSWLHWTKRMVE